MYGNGALIGIVIAITVNLHKMIRKAQIQVPVAFFVAAVGTTTRRIAGWRTATRTNRRTARAATASAWPEVRWQGSDFPETPDGTDRFPVRASFGLIGKI